MHLRKLLILFLTLLLSAAVWTALQTVDPALPTPVAPVVVVENVRDYAPALATGRPDYVVDGGALRVGRPGHWVALPTPPNVIVGAVDVIPAPAGAAGSLPHEIIYIGAANQLAIYRSDDRGQSWLRGELTHPVVHGHLVGGVTDLAVDPVQKLVYVGTDTAGLFRVRDRGGALESSAHLLLDRPVRQVVTDRSGSGLTVARTDWHLYRAEEFGLRWLLVNNLHSLPTTVAIAQTTPATLWVGTVDRGLLRSADGITWSGDHASLDLSPAARLYVDALATDPVRPGLVYAAVSALLSEHQARPTLGHVIYRDGDATPWVTLDRQTIPARITELLPVGGRPGAVYALTLVSRTPQPLGEAPVVNAGARPPAPAITTPLQAGLAWLLAGMALFALLFAVLADIASRPTLPVPPAPEWDPDGLRRDSW